MDDYDSTSTYSSGSDAEVDEELEDLGAGAMSTQVGDIIWAVHIEWRIQLLTEIRILTVLGGVNIIWHLF